ncbi:MAG: helix-turn-helix domain-containing protein [Actinomycetota bacterium]|nr:helix-turn-helix domain-containing protein [Actinomycetota bacterium]
MALPRSGQARFHAVVAVQRSRPYPPDSPPSLLTTREVARVLAISEPSVRRLAREGALPRVRIGSSVRFRRRDVAELVGRGLEPKERGEPAGGPAHPPSRAARDGRHDGG